MHSRVALHLPLSHHAQHKLLGIFRWSNLCSKWLGFNN